MGVDAGTRANHPSGEQLVAFASDELDGADAIAAAAHINGCSSCTGTVARYRLVREVLRVADVPEPPAALLMQAKRLFATLDQPRAQELADRLAPLRRIVAELIFDSGAGLSPALAGFRGGGDRHLTYVAGEVQVDLRLQPPASQSGAWRVQGQVDADALAPSTAVEMVSAGEEWTVVQTTTDEHGMFDLAAPAGRYDILVRLPYALQILPGLELG